MAYTGKTSEGENRGNDPRPLAREAEEAAPMVAPIQPQHSTHAYRGNGIATHDLEVTISAWYRAWATIRPWVSGIVVLLTVGAWHFLSSSWFNQPVKATELTAVTSSQALTNQKFESEISSVRSAIDSQGRALERIAIVVGDTAAKVNFMAGALSGNPLQAYSPPPATFPPYGRLQAQPAQPTGWTASRE